MPDRYRFDACDLRARERALYIDDQVVPLGARAFDVLLMLVEQRGRVVTKDELLDAAWPGLVVEENNLQVQISALRKLLGARSITTVAGRGYCFTALVDEESLFAGGATEIPSTRARTNVPTGLPPLYGRDDDLQAVQELLDANRLVTIVGAGGIGKTRLAQALAHSLHGRFADGTWLVELAPLANASLVPSSVAQTLGLQMRGQRSFTDELIATLEPLELLLVLDNCEHLLDVASTFVQALHARAPRVWILVTSQEALRLNAEQLFRLGTLPVPEPADGADVSSAMDHGAVRLFVERVRALDPRFVLDAANCPAVIDICRQLDGLALAIELAAARVPLLGVQGVLERLGVRLRMLTAGSRIALRRHQTLRAAFDWSYGLLDEREKIVFRRLGVFSGGCSIEAAQGVTEDAELDAWAVFDVVASLVDKSLIVADGRERPRYRLFESARAYALEKLAEAGETAVFMQRHAQYLAAYFKRLADGLYEDTITEDRFIQGRAQELDNLRAALGWALDADPQVALELMTQSAPLIMLLPWGSEGTDYCNRLAERLASTLLSPKAAAQFRYVSILWSLGRLRLAGSTGEALEMDAASLGVLDDPPRQAHAMCLLALAATWRGELAAARKALVEMDSLGVADEPSWLRARQLHVWFLVEQDEGKPEKATTAQLEAALTRLEAKSDGEGFSAFMLRCDLADDSLMQERWDEAVQRLSVLAGIGRRQRRDLYSMSWALAPLALVLTELGQLAEARAVVLEALPVLKRTGTRSEYAPILAELAARRGRIDTAARLLGAGIAALKTAGGRRKPVQQRAYERALALVEAADGGHQMQAWLAEGATLDEEAIAQLVVDES